MGFFRARLISNSNRQATRVKQEPNPGPRAGAGWSREATRTPAFSPRSPRGCPAASGSASSCWGDCSRLSKGRRTSSRQPKHPLPSDVIDPVLPAGSENAYYREHGTHRVESNRAKKQKRQGDSPMSNPQSKSLSLRLAVLALLAASAGAVYSQTVAPTNSLPDPYVGTQFGKLPDGRTWGSTAGIGDRSRRQEHLGRGALRRLRAAIGHEARRPVRLRRLEPRADPQIRRERQTGEELRRRNVRVAARPLGRPRRQRVGDGRRRQGRQGPPGLQVQPRRQGADDARQGRRRRQRPDEFNAPSAVLVAPNGDIFVADGHGGNTNARIVKFDKTGKFIKTWGKKGTGARRVRRPARAGDGFARTAVRRRPRQQPHPDLRPGRQFPRAVDAVQPAERRLHRQERRDLRGRFGSPDRSPRTTATGSAACASAAPRTAR